MRCSFLFAVLVLAACATGPTTPASLTQSDSTAIRATLTGITTAGTTGHYRELGRFFTEDGVWMVPGQAAVEGRQQVQEWFTVGAKEWEHRILEMEGAGNLAYVRAAYSLSLEIPQFVPVTGKALAVMRRQPDGSWLIARYASSCDTTCEL